MKPWCIGLCLLGLVHSARAQTITVVVWNLPAQGNLLPNTRAQVQAVPAANTNVRNESRPQQAVAGGEPRNTYTLNVSALGLFVRPGTDQRLDVQLFHFNYPILAPECFALKTQYELLFRSEARLNPRRSREEIEHIARLKYADGLLALPNPNR
jgi:hypothetical protein